jgi:hypothetical protein
MQWYGWKVGLKVKTWFGCSICYFGACLELGWTFANNSILVIVVVSKQTQDFTTHNFDQPYFKVKGRQLPKPFV